METKSVHVRFSEWTHKEPFMRIREERISPLKEGHIANFSKDTGAKCNTICIEFLSGFGF